LTASVLLSVVISDYRSNILDALLSDRTNFWAWSQGAKTWHSLIEQNVKTDGTLTGTLIQTKPGYRQILIFDIPIFDTPT